MHVLIILSSKKCVRSKVFVFNKQVSKDGVMVFFSSKTLIFTGYRFVLPCKCIMHLAVRPLVHLECCIVLKSHVPGSGDVVL